MFRDKKAFVFDLEGVFFAGEEVLPGAREVMAALREREIPHRFITNISRQSAGEVCAHMKALGVDPGPGRIVGVLDRAGAFLRRRLGGGRILVLGSEPLKACLAREGFEVVSPDAEATAGAVLVGIDENVGYESMSAAARVAARGLPFFTLNPDVRMPREGESFSLGGGAIAAAVQASAGRTAEVIGKPEPFLFEEALSELNARSSDAVMVGDNLRTDIAGARRAGMASVWVNRWGAIAGDPDVTPELEVKRVDELLPHMPEG